MAQQWRNDGGRAMGADCSDCNGAGCNRYFYAIVSTWVFVSRVSSWTHHTQMCVSRVCDQIFRHSGKRKRQARLEIVRLSRVGTQGVMAGKIARRACDRIAQGSRSERQPWAALCNPFGIKMWLLFRAKGGRTLNGRGSLCQKILPHTIKDDHCAASQSPSATPPNGSRYWIGLPRSG
jgi:hypothetical protein